MIAIDSAIRAKHRVAAALPAALLVCVALAAGTHPAWAQFGAFDGPQPAAMSGIAGWVLAEQAMFYRSLAGMIRAAKSDGSALWGLMAISFVYGIFHAAGPGHGKAVISSYMLANEETWRRGITLSFASAVMQSLTAIAIVGVAAVLLGATAKLMGDTVRVIEMVGYGLIVAIGARLLWVKGRGFIGALHALNAAPEGAAACGCQHRHGLRHARIPSVIIRSTITTESRTCCHGVTPMVPNRRNSPDRTAGGAAYRQSWPLACGRVRGRSSCSSSRWRRGCSGPASPRRS